MKLAPVPYRFLSFAIALVLPAYVAAEPVDYSHDVKPLFKKHCYACHGALKQEGNLRVDTAAAILRGGDAGPAIEPGSIRASNLLDRIADPEESTRMPQESAPLSPEEIATIASWVEQGAAHDPNEHPEPDPREHWAFKRPARPNVPRIESSPLPIRNPIDAFIAAKYQQQRLQPVDETDNAMLLRRVTLDLIGLLPTREELAAFLADDSPDAYERVVDRLLASPQYGERWGRHWMDVWRYSDWYGRRTVPDVMSSYPTIWRWRDWIVSSLNTDKGYDQMIVEMLAADEVAPEDDSTIVATGFLVRNWFKWNYSQWMKDNVEHTGKAFLGLTFNCAHCHDHKYDPISQREYFAMRAFFEPLDLRQDRVPGQPDPGKFQDYVYGVPYGPIAGGMIRVYDRHLDAKTQMYARGDQRSIIEGEPPVEPGLPAIFSFEIPTPQPVQLPPVAVYPGLKPFIIEEELAKANAALEVSQKRLADLKAASATTKPAVMSTAEAEVAAAEQEMASLKLRMAAGKARFERDDSATTLAHDAVRAERSAVAARTAATTKAAEFALADLKEKQAPVEQIAAGTTQLQAAQQAAATAMATATAPMTGSEEFTLLSPTYPEQSTGRRTVLANAIANRQNPLTARVAVNHIWMRHFGQPIVESVFDFGRNGKLPTNPELLDWLAVEFMNHAWSMKHLHRLIVLSSTYRLSSKAATDSPNRPIDPDNKLLWRFARKRMESELVRDSILFAAGTLDTTMGGPEVEVQDAPQSRRRSVYLSHHGETIAPLMSTFDGANPNECYRRIESVVPQQALALANGDLAVESSRIIARRLWNTLTTQSAEQPPTDAEFIESAFELLLTRDPTSEERDASLKLLEKQQTAYREAKPTGDEPAAEDGTKPSFDPAMRARESLCHALLSHHDFISIR